MDTTRVCCVDKAIFAPKSNVKVVAVNIIDRHVVLLLQNKLCCCLELQNEIKSLFKKQTFFWLAHWSKPVFSISTLHFNLTNSNSEKLIGQNPLNLPNYPVSSKMNK